MIREEIQLIEERQLELLSIMKMSDEHAAKCSKINKAFSEEYPSEFEEYIKANEEYNENESKLLVLHERENEEELTRIEIE